MRVFSHFTYKGKAQTWRVPKGVTSAHFECWGAGGGMPSAQAERGRKNQTVGGTGPANIYFTNTPHHQSQLGRSFSNNAGYVAGDMDVTEGDEFYVYVGGNGQPGHSTIRLHNDGKHVSVSARGGAGGWNGGGDGGRGAHTYQNLFNDLPTHISYESKHAPKSAKKGQLWYDTDARVLRECTATYKDSKSSGKWETVTRKHPDYVGSSGGGGGGATDIRKGAHDLSSRIIVAAGSGGAAGQWNRWGDTNGVWSLKPCPKTPNPPFGSDDDSSGPTGINFTWATAISYLSGGWGRGGVGGGGPNATVQHTVAGGWATSGGAGGPATNHHKLGVACKAISGSAGQAGTPLNGGKRGSYSGHGTSGRWGVGGNGEDATGKTVGGQPDDWSAGGGGGGGGYYGGGGGAQGYLTAGQRNTMGGGGGGGSNFVSQYMTSPVLVGSARPPYATPTKYGANGRGGFARISYRQPPDISWLAAPTAAPAGEDFYVKFTTEPALSRGALRSYSVGTGAANDTEPGSFTTYSLNTNERVEVDHAFTAPAAGNVMTVFVRSTDTEGDSTDWLVATVTGMTADESTPATITAPSENAQFEDSATVSWDLGNQTPEVAYRLAMTGTPLAGQQAKATQTVVDTGWLRGGSRVNFATDPGFDGTNVWSSESNTDLVNADTTYPGVSGSDGKIAWTQTDDGSAENHTTTWTNLVPGLPYRVSLNLASGTANDLRSIILEVWDTNQMLNAGSVQFLGDDAGDLEALEVTFTPTSPTVYLVLRPTGSAPTDALAVYDFEDNTVQGWSGGTVDDSNANTGDYALANATASAATLDITSVLTKGPGFYVVQAWAYAPSAGDSDATVSVSGYEAASGSTPTRDAYTLIRVPFRWDGTTATTLSLGANASSAETYLYDDISVSTIIGDEEFALQSWDFSDGTPDDFTETDDGTSTVDLGTDAEGNTALVVTGPTTVTDPAATVDLTPYLWGPGYYVVHAVGLAPSASTQDVKIDVEGTGLIATVEATDTTRDAEVALTLTFFWDGSGSAALGLWGDANTATYSQMDVWATGSGHGPAGTTDSSQVTYLADLLVEFAYADTGDTDWFSSTDANGQTGTPSLDGSGAAVLTGTDVVSDTLSYSGDPLKDGRIGLEVLSVDALIAGSLGAIAFVDVEINPAQPVAPTVTLSTANDAGLVELDIDAADSNADYPTVSFDIYRDDVRIATGLLPDDNTRKATYLDAPSIGAHTYMVRAYAASGAYAETD